MGSSVYFEDAAKKSKLSLLDGSGPLTFWAKTKDVQKNTPNTFLGYFQHPTQIRRPYCLSVKQNIDDRRGTFFPLHLQHPRMSISEFIKTTLRHKASPS